VPTVLLVRHAQASFGAADYDVLSETGLEQTAVLNRALARRDLTVTRIACGTVRRQRETAEPCATERGLELTVDERWNEYETEDVLAHHGAAAVGLDGAGEGGREITSREFQAVLDDALDGWVSAGAESAARQPWPDFLATRLAALEEFAAALGRGEAGLVFSSGGVIGALAAHLLGGHDDLFPRLNRVYVNTGISKLAVGAAGISLVTFNDHAHIDEGGGALLTYR
jgi:broad specificity phosphatase PhoE